MADDDNPDDKYIGLTYTLPNGLASVKVTEFDRHDDRLLMKIVKIPSSPEELSQCLGEALGLLLYEALTTQIAMDERVLH